MHYRICGLTIESPYAPPSFSAFAVGEGGVPDIRITWGAGCKPGELLAHHPDFDVHRHPDGWLYHAHRGGEQLCVSADYSRGALHFPGEERPGREVRVLLLLRVLIECRLAREGVISLHSACVVMDGQAVAFTGPSGTGKSTRAQQWVDALGARWLSGDRPAVDAGAMQACGVPWDGKEQHYRNDCAPLRAILDVRRGHAPLVRRLSVKQARRVLMQQCFLPMWDADTAALVMMSIGRLARSGRVLRMVCSPSGEAARSIHAVLYHTPENIPEEAIDMKIKEGFVLRNIVGEYMVMPTGANVARFEGSVALNEVSAFIYRKLETPISEADLLEQLLAEYDVDRDTAQRDLAALLDTFRSYGMLDEQP